MSSENLSREAPIQSEFNCIYRFALGNFIMFGIPLRYLHKHKQGMIDASSRLKMHHAKELGIRFCIGYFIASWVTVFMFGNRSRDKPMMYALGLSKI